MENLGTTKEHLGRKTKQAIENKNEGYAQNWRLVNLILVNFFSVFFVITRDQSDVYGRNLVEIDPTSLPQLSKQLRDQNSSQKSEKHEIQRFKQNELFWFLDQIWGFQTYGGVP